MKNQIKIKKNYKKNFYKNLFIIMINMKIYLFKIFIYLQFINYIKNLYFNIY